MTLDELYTVLEESIMIDKADITDETSTENVEEWDSLGHITLLSELDEKSDGKTSELPELANVSSVKSLVKILRDNNLLEE